MENIIEVIGDEWYGDDYVLHYDGLHTKFDYIEIEEETYPKSDEESPEGKTRWVQPVAF